MKLISVTEALSPWNDYSNIIPERLEYAKQRGMRLHAAAAAKLSGTFLVSPLLPEDAGYWQSLERWIDEYVVEVIDVEPELVDRSFGFVGHPDLICRLKSSSYSIVDFKTPQVESKSWKIQISAYCHLANKHYTHVMQWSGVVVQPHPEGNTAKVIIFNNSHKYFQIFLSCLNAYRYFAKETQC